MLSRTEGEDEHLGMSEVLVESEGTFEVSSLTVF